MIVSWDQDSGLIRLFFYLLSFFLAFYKLTLKIFVRVFLGSIEAKVFELGVCKDDKFCIMGLITGSLLLFYLSIFLSFQSKFVSQFSQELLEVESLVLVKVCRTSDYIVGLRLKLVVRLRLRLIFLS